MMSQSCPAKHIPPAWAGCLLVTQPRQVDLIEHPAPRVIFGPGVLGDLTITGVLYPGAAGPVVDVSGCPHIGTTDTGGMVLLPWLGAKITIPGKALYVVTHVEDWPGGTACFLEWPD